MEKLDKIIRALEQHEGAEGREVSCVGCPYEEYEEYCLTVLHKDALRILKLWDAIHKDIWDRTHEIVRLKKELKAVRAELDVARKHSEDLMEKLCRSCGNGDYVHEYEMYVCRCGGDCQWVPMEVDNG